MNSILIYLPKITPRAEYVFCSVLQSLLGVGFKLTNDAGEFQKYTFPKFSYASKPLGDELFFGSTDLLFENFIANSRFENKQINEAFFVSNSAFDVDIFAAIFYLLSRYEEYADENFSFEKSILHRSNLLQQPIVNQWMIQFKNIAAQKFPALQFRSSAYKLIPTIDVDRAFAFKARNNFKTVAGFCKDFLKGNFHEMKTRLAVLQNKIADPFDVFDWLENNHRQHDLTAKYFFHCGNYEGVDKNIQLDSVDFKSLINKLKATADIGLHSSVKSITENELMQAEKVLLKKITEKKVESNRQHFIKMKFPNYFRLLLQNEIKHDYTLGYATAAGFRAGICNSFYWYDLENEQTTDLLLHPFCWMDFSFENVEEEKMWQTTQQIVDAVKNVNGEFYAVFHNHSFSNIYGNNFWKNNYNKFFRAAL